MTNQNVFIATILDYLLLKSNGERQLASLHPNCAVLSASPNNKFWILIKNEDVVLYDLYANKIYLIDKEIVKNAKEGTERIVEYFLNGVLSRYDSISLIRNVVWNEEERRVSFSEMYSNPYAENYQLIDCDFSKPKLHVKRSQSLLPLYSVPQIGFSDDERTIPSYWLDDGPSDEYNIKLPSLPEGAQIVDSDW